MSCFGISEHIVWFPISSKAFSKLSFWTWFTGSTATVLDYLLPLGLVLVASLTLWETQKAFQGSTSDFDQI